VTAGNGGANQPSATTTTVHHVTATTTTTVPAATTTRPATTTTRPPTTTTTVAVPPTIKADGFTVVNFSSNDLNVLANDGAGTSPIDPSTVTITAAPGKATAYRVNSDHTIHYQSKLLTLAGTDTLQYRACDTSGRCATATVTITIVLL
jgi:hypothetical protein